MKVKENHERVKTRNSHHGKHAGKKCWIYAKTQKKFGDPRSRRRPIEMHPKNLIRLTNEYEIVRNKKNRSTLNNIHAPRANIEEVN